MILLFPQATESFNKLFAEMIKKSYAQSFLNKSFDSYRMNKVSKVVLVVLQNKMVEDYLNEYLYNSVLIKDFEMIVLKKETSGSICTSLMSISSLKNQEVRQKEMEKKQKRVARTGGIAALVLAAATLVPLTSAVIVSSPISTLGLTAVGFYLLYFRR